MTADPTFWDGIAEKYAAQPVENPAAFERKIAITGGLMRPDAVIADVGCGTGSLALILAPHAAEVHGLDVSGEMVRIARGKAEAQGAGNVRFHQGGLDQPLPFAPESLDGLCAYSILHLVHDLPGTLRRLHAAIKPGGFFVSSTVCLGDTWLPMGPLIKLMQAFGKAPYVASFDRAHLAAQAEAAGFVDTAFHDVGAKDTVAFMTARKPG